MTIGHYILGKSLISLPRAIPFIALSISDLLVSSILGKPLGKGTFGQVKQGTHILTGEKVGYVSGRLFLLLSLILEISPASI